jgi:ferredoxin/flavodoxin---NADP+ reductase
VSERPFRVAVVGSGPSGFYAAGELVNRTDPVIEVDMYDRLPTPWGLVRSGVAPDHPKIKSVTRIYEKTAANPRFRFYGNVELGREISPADLLERYDAVVYAVGAETDRPLEIPGADLPGVWPATKFVGWYNGHPDHRDHAFDLSGERAVVIGNGNVAVDVARMLSLERSELESTDIADHALEALEGSGFSEIVMVGRRGPVQAAFTTPELRELGELAAADVVVDPEQLLLDDHSRAHLEDGAKPTTVRNIELLAQYAARPPGDRPRRIVLRFLRSPVEILGDGKVEAVVLEENAIHEEDGVLMARPTGRREEVPAQLVLSSIGYRGLPLPGVPFDDARGVIPNEAGRVTGGDREYVVGWIKRGPSGIIGTNKKDAKETVAGLVEDLGSRAAGAPVPPAEEIDAWVHERQPRVVTQTRWEAIDRHERGLGEPAGRERVKLTRVEELLAAGGHAPSRDDNA